MSDTFLDRFHSAVRSAGPDGISSAELLAFLFPGQDDTDGSLIAKVRRQPHWLNRKGYDVRSITRYHLVSGPRKQGRTSALNSRVVALLATGPMTHDEIAAAVGCKVTSVFNALRKLRADGVVIDGRTVYVDMSTEASPQAVKEAEVVAGGDLRASLRNSIAQLENEVAERRLKIEAMRSLLVLMGAPA